jgi:hypothetical protein
MEVYMIDFFITAKREDFYGRITHLMVHRNQNGQPSSDYRIETKDQVVNSIESIFKKEYYTWYSNRPGAKVEVISVNGNKFLRTDRNQTSKDNLDNLPNF